MLIFLLHRRGRQIDLFFDLCCAHYSQSIIWRPITIHTQSFFANSLVFVWECCLLCSVYCTTCTWNSVCVWSQSLTSSDSAKTNNKLHTHGVVTSGTSRRIANVIITSIASRPYPIAVRTTGTFAWQTPNSKSKHTHTHETNICVCVCVGSHIRFAYY